MMDAISKALAEVGAQVLENLAFMYLVPGLEEEQGVEEREVCATVRFEGPFAGCLSIKVPEQTLVEVANNMLGADEDHPCSEEQKFDALGELANVICGNLVASLGKGEDVFNLGKPQVSASGAEAEPVQAQGPASVTRLTLEQGWAELRLVTQGPEAICEEGAVDAG